MANTDAPAIELFLGHAKVETFRRDVRALRSSCRAEGTPAIQDAWDKFERWVTCVNPDPDPIAGLREGIMGAIKHMAERGEPTETISALVRASAALKAWQENK